MPNWDSAGHGEYNFDLWAKLETTIDSFEQDRAAYWRSRLDDEDWTPVKQLLEDADEIADLIRKRASALRSVGDRESINAIHRLYEDSRQRSGPVPPEVEARIRSAMSRADAERLLNYLRSEPDLGEGGIGDANPGRLVWERMCIDDAWESVSLLRDRVGRRLKLERLVSELLQGQLPSAVCLRYLALVSRCYIHGLDAECVVMCRSAMEAAFRQKVSVDHCHRAGRLGDTLNDRIQAAFAEQNRLLPSNAALQTDARNVRDRGNKVIHGDPDLVKDVFDTVSRALRVVEALSKLPDVVSGDEP